MLVQNLNLANLNVLIQGDKYLFNEKGIAELSTELAEELLKLKGYQLVEEEKKDQAGADKKEKEPKETTLATGTVEVEGLNVGEATEMADDEEVFQEDLLPNYESLSNKELKDLINEKGKKAPSGATKAELIEILKA